MQDCTPENKCKADSNLPVSHIWALMVFPSTFMDRLANSTPIVDLDSRLNSLRVNRESTRSCQANDEESDFASQYCFGQKH